MKKKLSPCEKCPLYHLKPVEFFPPACLSQPTNSPLIIHQTPRGVEWPTMNLGEAKVTLAVKCGQGFLEKDIPAKAIGLCHEAYLDKEISDYTGEKILLIGPTAVHSTLKRKRRIRELLGHPFHGEHTVTGFGGLFMAVWDVGHYYEMADRQVIVDILRALNWVLGREIL